MLLEAGAESQKMLCLKASFHSVSLRKIIRGLERTRTFFFVLKSLVPTQSSQDKGKFSCPFQSMDNFPEWKLALINKDILISKGLLF